MEVAVADLELSKELYKLSGWKWEPDQASWFWEQNDSEAYICPAYHLSFLLRKLPSCNLWRMGSGTWRVTITQLGDGGRERIKHMADAGTPENAVCTLAIELHKQGILPSRNIEEKINE